MVGPDLLLLLFAVEYSVKGWENLYNRMRKSNNVHVLLLLKINWVKRIKFRNEFDYAYGPKCFQNIHTYKTKHISQINLFLNCSVLFKMKLIESPNCLFCGEEGSLVYTPFRV